MSNVDRIVQENDRLTRQVRDLTARLTAIEASRWWRLHPRTALRRFRDGRTEDAAPAGEAPPQHRFPVDFDENDVELCERVAPFTLTTPPRIYALVRSVEYVVKRELPGAVVECGVWRGGSVMAVILTLLRLGATDRELYLYDTFTGMTPPTEEDVLHSGTSAADVLAASGPESDAWAIAPLDQVRQNISALGYPEERIHFVAGRVEDTLPQRAPDEIALLRLDTDWYESTKHELEHLYPRLVRGGVLILDDYGYWQGARRATDEYFAEGDAPVLLNRVDHTARIAVKP